MLGITAKPMARPTTRALRWSKVMPRSLLSHRRMSPPEEPGFQVAADAQREGAEGEDHRDQQRRFPAVRHAQADRSGRRLQPQAASTMPTGVSSSRLKCPAGAPST